MASLTLYQAPTSNFWSTTLNGAINDSVQTITLTSTTGLQAPGYLVINRVDSSGTATASAREVIYFTGISGSDITGVTRAADNSTAREHADASVVESHPTVGMWNNMRNEINRAVADWYDESDGATITFNLNNGKKQRVTLGGNRTLALSNAYAGATFLIKLTQDATGSRTVTWFSTISWPDGSAPVLTTTAAKSDVFAFIQTATDEYDGFIIGQNL